MISEFSHFAAQLCDFMHVSGGGHCSVSALTSSSELDQHGECERGSDEALPSRFDRFNQLALELFALQFAYNEPFRRFCEARGVRTGSVQHWTQIPAMPTAAFKELELSCLPANERTLVFHSSGTTGQRPSRHFHNRESLEVYEASLWPSFRDKVLVGCQVTGSRFQDTSHLTSGTPHLIHGTPRLALFSPTPAQTPHSSLVYMFETVRRKLGAPASSYLCRLATDGSWTLDFSAALDALRASVEDARPLVMLGAAFSFVHLLDDLAEQDLKFELPPGSRAMETGGYKGRSRVLLKADLHSSITERLGILGPNILCEYGMSELSSQAYDRVAGDGRRVTEDASPSCHSSLVTRHFHFPPWARAQVISPETGREVDEGETGLLRIFDLANVFSVMAIQTEDLAVRCNTGFEPIGRHVAAEPRGCSLLAT